MGKINTFFFDSYALYEIFEGNPAYEPYANNITIVTTRLNLMEFHYGILVKRGKEFADRLFDEFLKFTVNITDDIIKASNEFRALNKSKKLSYVDCIGYTLAKFNGIKFLTGDKEFKDLDNVEFIK